MQPNERLNTPLKWIRLLKPASSAIVGANDQRPDYEYTDGVTFHAFELTDGGVATAVVYDLKGNPAMTARATRSGNTVRVETQGSNKPWSVRIGGKTAAPAAGENAVTITL